jgi:hypothetical protein
MNDADFKLAIRLLHVWTAWSGTPGNEPHPAREDVLYPRHPKTCANDGSGREGKMREAIKALLAKYPYSASNGGAERG